MRTSGRGLVIFGVVIGVLIIVSIVLGLTLGGERTASLLPEDTPEGTVQRYILAIGKEDYEEAYGYLSPAALAKETYRDTYEEWIQRASTWGQGEWKAILEESSVAGNEATVIIRIDVLRSGSIVDPVYTRRYTYQLRKEGAIWIITAPLSPPYLY